MQLETPPMPVAVRLQAALPPGRAARPALRSGAEPVLEFRGLLVRNLGRGRYAAAAAFVRDQLHTHLDDGPPYIVGCDGPWAQVASMLRARGIPVTDSTPKPY